MYFLLHATTRVSQSLIKLMAFAEDLTNLALAAVKHAYYNIKFLYIVSTWSYCLSAPFDGILRPSKRLYKQTLRDMDSRPAGSGQKLRCKNRHYNLACLKDGRSNHGSQSLRQVVQSTPNHPDCDFRCNVPFFNLVRPPLFYCINHPGVNLEDTTPMSGFGSPPHSFYTAQN
jgi:hypothetical protein